jgi:8-hydroxy-5-deazaflavin:NADPH oxidoreductase
MRVAVVGGTGRMGAALAWQLSKKNEVIIGSRDPARAEVAAARLEGVRGLGNLDAVKAAETVVVTLPFDALGSASDLRDAAKGMLVVSAVNPIVLRGGLLVYGKETGSAAEDLALALPGSRVVTGFNNIPVRMLQGELKGRLDVLVAAESKKSYEEAARLMRTVAGLNPLYAGPLSEAGTVERITPLVLNLARLNGTGALAPRFVSRAEVGPGA